MRVWKDILKTETEAQGKYGKISWKQKRKHKESMERYLGNRNESTRKVWQDILKTEVRA